MNEMILIKQDGPIIEVILNRPEKRNAMNAPAVRALGEAFSQVEKLKGGRVVFLRGEGKAFSSGLDLTDMQSTIEFYGESWRDNLFPMTREWQTILTSIERCSLPVIGLLHGYALGMGLEIALACDMRIAVEGTRLALPESKLGLIPDVGGTTRLTRLVGPAKAKEYIMTGRDITLTLAEEWGIVNYVVPEDQLMPKAQELANQLIEAAPLAVSYAKRVINDIMESDNGMSVEAWAQAQLMRSKDLEIGIQAAITKQPPEWTGQ